jgi:hypothetical protein
MIHQTTPTARANMKNRQERGIKEARQRERRRASGPQNRGFNAVRGPVDD